MKTNMNCEISQTCASAVEANGFEQWFNVTGDLDDFIFFYEESKDSSDK